MPGHLTQNLEADNTATFYFVDGLYDVPPLPDLEYECAPPNLVYFQYSSMNPSGSSFQSQIDFLRLRDANDPHDQLRRLWREYGPQDHSNVTSVTLEYIQNIIEDEGPFHGVIGASEGGCAAATVLLDHLQRSRGVNDAATMMCGVFFISTPALQADGSGYVLWDKAERRISVPTCHIFSDSDPIAWMARYLANTCQEDGREIILHDKGHVIPHTKEMMVDVANFIRRVKAAAGAKPSAV